VIFGVRVLTYPFKYERVSKANPPSRTLPLCLLSPRPPEIEGPQQVKVKDVTASSALFSWSQPVTEVNGVTVTYGPTADPLDETSVDLGNVDTQYSAGDLKPDTEYKMSLTSRRGGVTSEPVTRTFTTGKALRRCC